MIDLRIGDYVEVLGRHDRRDASGDSLVGLTLQVCEIDGGRVFVNGPPLPRWVDLAPYRIKVVDPDYGKVGS